MPEITEEELTALTARAARGDEADAIANELAELRTSHASAASELAAATEATRNALIAANPAIPPDLIVGTTVAQITQAVANANAIANRMAEAAKNTGRGPLGFAGVSTRQTPDTSAMTPIQKITYGLQHERDQHLA